MVILKRLLIFIFLLHDFECYLKTPSKCLRKESRNIKKDGSKNWQRSHVILIP